VNKSAITRGETALVIGCGTIGIAIIAGRKGRGTETHCDIGFLGEAPGNGHDP
jgi:threonine dehydrogenase-like Zn-dependent dehydrogenase